MEEDILQEISVDKFKELHNFLHKDVPSSLFVLNMLKSMEKEDPTKETELKVLCPQGDTSSGVVIVIVTYLNKCGWNFIKMYCSPDKVSLLQLALIKTKKIKWTNLLFEELHFKLLSTLESVFQNKNITFDTKTEYQCMFLPSELFELMGHEFAPDEFIIHPLTSEDATLIDETWAYHSSTTYDYICHSILCYGGMGLICKQTGQLVSWAVGVWNTIGMVHTMPDYRQRGCAQAVIKALARQMISKNVQPVCLIKHENAPSLRLFERIGFVDAGKYFCLFVK